MALTSSINSARAASAVSVLEFDSTQEKKQAPGRKLRTGKEEMP